MTESNGEQQHQDAPPGVVHERLKRDHEAAGFMADPLHALQPAPSGDPHQAATESSGRGTRPGGDIEEKLHGGGGGDETSRPEPREPS